MKTLTRPSHAPQGLPSRQKGAILLIGMSILIVVTLFALAAIRGITAQERIAGGFYDREISFAAAESALHYAERKFMTGNDSTFSNQIVNADQDPVCGYTAGCPANSPPNTLAFFNDNANGYSRLNPPYFHQLTTATFKSATSGSVDDGNPPKYLVVRLENGGDCGEAVRINGIGVGRNENTITVLETIVCKPS